MALCKWDTLAHDCDVIVVGGGPAGAAAAARLAARGFSTIVVDRAAFPRDKVCGDFVSPAALAELADLGVARTEAFSATNAIGEFALHVDRDLVGVMAIPEVEGLPALGRVIPRGQLDAWVVDAARQAGATVLDGRKVTAVEQEPGGVMTVHGHGAAGPWRLRARLLVGADGSNSVVARTLRGIAPPRQDRMLAVRAYFDDVAGPADQATISLCADSFPGYCWLFPSADGQANVGVGMLVSTYPQAARNLRELLQRLIGQDGPMRSRLQGASIRGKILGCPLATYNPQLPLVGDRIMLVGDAAGLINPINGEGIQYALHSGRLAADVAAGRLSLGRLDAASLAGYEQRVHDSLRLDMAFSRLIVELIRNRALSPAWLRAVRVVASHASTDPDYAYRASCVATGMAPTARMLTLSMVSRTARQATTSHHVGGSRHRLFHGLSQAKAGGTTGHTVMPRELARWAGGVRRALAELATQLARAGLTRTRDRGLCALADRSDKHHAR